MLGLEDLHEIGEWFSQKYTKTMEKVKQEGNPKIVSFKIRSFIEMLRDKLHGYEPQQADYGGRQDIAGSNQLDRIEASINEVLTQVNRMTGAYEAPSAMPLDMQSQSI